MIEWDDLRFVLAISRAGTMNGAARALKVNQTTVARRLGALEERLGVLLFDRTPDGFHVTGPGQKILPLATQMEDAALLLERLVAGSDEKLEGTVRLACSETFAIGFIVEELAAFRTAHPSISLEVVTGNPPINLLRREADVAIRTAMPPQSDLVVRRLTDVEWYLYGGPSAARKFSIDDCNAVGFEGELADISAAQWLAQRVLPERMVLRSNSIPTAAVAIRAGVGVGALPAFFGDRDPSLRRLLPEPIVVNHVWLAVRAEMQKQARVRALMDFLVELFAKNAARFGGPRPS